MDYEKKLQELAKRYEHQKREADTRKGALLNTVESLKAEHGIGTAEEAKNLITELEGNIQAWETERDELMKKINLGLDGGGSSGKELEGMERLPKDSLDNFDVDEFDEFED